MGCGSSTAKVSNVSMAPRSARPHSAKLASRAALLAKFIASDVADGSSALAVARRSLVCAARHAARVLSRFCAGASVLVSTPVADLQGSLSFTVARDSASAGKDGSTLFSPAAWAGAVAKPLDEDAAVGDDRFGIDAYVIRVLQAGVLVLSTDAGYNGTLTGVFAVDVFGLSISISVEVALAPRALEPAAARLRGVPVRGDDADPVQLALSAVRDACVRLGSRGWTARVTGGASRAGLALQLCRACERSAQPSSAQDIALIAGSRSADAALLKAAQLLLTTSSLVRRACGSLPASVRVAFDMPLGGTGLALAIEADVSSALASRLGPDATAGDAAPAALRAGVTSAARSQRALAERGLGAALARIQLNVLAMRVLLSLGGCASSTEASLELATRSEAGPPTAEPGEAAAMDACAQLADRLAGLLVLEGADGLVAATAKLAGAAGISVGLTAPVAIVAEAFGE